MQKIEGYTRKSSWGCRSKAGKGTKVKYASKDKNTLDTVLHLTILHLTILHLTAPQCSPSSQPTNHVSSFTTRRKKGTNTERKEYT